ncbi:MAG: hypothetical protein DIU78_022475 [Pseudomonadota bacterium]|nr:MAG: hypothetical protein DIU78_07310 [Pseudomonadota bacterium]
MRIERAGRTRGARELLAHIRQHYGTIPAFAAQKGIDRIKLQKAIGGRIKRIDVEFAFEIERATGGQVLAAWWVPEPEP